MNRISIDLIGPGIHRVLPAVEGKIPIVTRATFTFSHENPRALKVSFLSGSNIIAGPFYVLDGHKIDYTRGDDKPFQIEPGQEFGIDLADGLAVAGMVEYEIGGK